MQQYVVLCTFNDAQYISAIYYLYQVLLRDDNCPFTPSLFGVLDCDQVRLTGRFVRHMKKVDFHVDYFLDVLDLDQIHRPDIF